MARDLWLGLAIFGDPSRFDITSQSVMGVFFITASLGRMPDCCMLAAYACQCGGSKQGRYEKECCHNGT